MLQGHRRTAETCWREAAAAAVAGLVEEKSKQKESSPKLNTLFLKGREQGNYEQSDEIGGP